MDGRRTDGRWTERKNNALTHPYHEGRSCSKFGYIPPSNLGGDSVTERWTDPGRTDAKKMLLSHTHYHEGSLCSKFGLIPFSCLRADGVMDRWMDARKNNVTLTDPYHEVETCCYVGSPWAVGRGNVGARQTSLIRGLIWVFPGPAYHSDSRTFMHTL